ncbi:MAG: hypothetical protein CM15mP49_05260 [Actinomycetota bacterium]|nr:MAG: hypothetical protein CM15mP49_05260 [Actinomycetota bacterium]
MPDALVDIKNHIMTVTLNRPKRMNAISGPMIVRMYDAFVEASANDDIRCVIVTGAEGNFTSGADLKAMSGDADDADTGIDMRARSKEDPEIHWKGLLRSYRPSKAANSCSRRCRHSRRNRNSPSNGYTNSWRKCKVWHLRRRWSLYPMGGSAVRLPSNSLHCCC